MILESGEVMIAQDWAEADYDDSRASGVLHLTNHRLVFEERRGGLSPAVETVVEVPLRSVRNVNVVSSFLGGKWLHLEFYPPHPKAIAFRLETPEQWGQAILHARTQAPPPPGKGAAPGPPPPPPAPGVVVHVAAPPPPPPVVMFPCPYCKTPQPSHLVRCSVCGGVLHP